MKVLFSFFLLLFLAKSIHIRRTQADPQATLLQAPCVFPNCIIIPKLPPVLAGYTFVQGNEAQGTILKSLPNNSPALLKTACDSTPRCVAFYTNGDLFASTYTYDPASQPRKLNVTDPLTGMYYKINTVALDGYIFVQGRDSPGFIITNISDSFKWKSNCDPNPACLGFNTLGSLKNWILPPSQYTDLNFLDPGSGIYIKKTFSPPQPSVYPGYTFYQGRDSPGNTFLTFNSVLAAKASCDANKKCEAFNTDGATKTIILPLTQWKAFHGQDYLAGTYVKTAYLPH